MTTEHKQDIVAMPMPQFVLIPLGMALMVDAAVLAAIAIIWPDRLASAGLGAGACVVGLTLGMLAIQPWKPRPIPAWPTMVLAAHGISMGAVILAAVSLYSAARPDAPAFLACVALPFPLAMIAQARLVLGPALGAPGGNGHSAHDTH